MAEAFANDLLIGEDAPKAPYLVALESFLPPHSDHPFRQRRIVFVVAQTGLL
jgi:hypothetical protein